MLKGIKVGKVHVKQTESSGSLSQNELELWASKEESKAKINIEITGDIEEFWLH